MTARRANQDDGGPPQKKTKENPGKDYPDTPVDPKDNDADSSKTLDSSAENEVISSSPYLKDFSDSTRRRVKICESFVSESQLIYSINRVPTDIAWGANKPFNNLSDIICGGQGTEKKPITFWIIGQATQIYFMNAASELTDKVTIGVLPSLLGVGKKTSDLLEGLSNSSKKQDESDWGELRATAWQSKYVNGARQKPIPFDAVYDAREGYSDKSSMRKLSLCDINRRDLILVEASIKRYAVDRQQFRRAWDKWQACLTLKAVSLVAKAPELVAEEKSSGISF
ncbi:hypothetical protein BJ138DRAFT_1105812 [Hygrophoropsis aurantiaca]|uniref:Uncharacterized protein n=1 Tax=Hygrophoropsis aurantiaca TaxID=72124 RepID=A0ACB7ZYC3_9AGAM|nr:hypothetical protein BJ138DRAFT_1105812 [Hygrophoropsis aurantiaca]